MAFNINTLSLSKGELIKIDKLNFLIDYVRSLNSKIDSNQSQNNTKFNNISSQLSSINRKLDSLEDSILTLKPKPTTFKDLDGPLPVYLPRGGKWAYHCFYCLLTEFSWRHNPDVGPREGWVVLASHSAVQSGNTKIWEGSGWVRRSTTIYLCRRILLTNRIKD